MHRIREESFPPVDDDGRPTTAQELRDMLRSGERNFSGIRLPFADLRSIDLELVHLEGADLTAADFTAARLTRANLRYARLKRTNFIGAELVDADMSAADMEAANFQMADLTRAILDDANLVAADLSYARLAWAQMRRASLQSATLRETDVDHTDFSGANFAFTILCDVDLRPAKSLESLLHAGASSIGIDTFFWSHGRIPAEFLRGCGVPASLITYAGSLIGASVEYYSCFISYGHRDEAFANRLHARMVREGLRVWFAARDVKAGGKLHEQIDEAIRLYDKVLLVLSTHSMQSDWVTTEMYKARRREQKEKRRMLFPITLVPFDALRNWESFDADSGKDQAREVREYFIPDFSEWKDNAAFEVAFTRLLKDLRAPAIAAAT